MAIDKEAVRVKVLELIGAEDEAKRFRASIGERFGQRDEQAEHPDRVAA